MQTFSQLHPIRRFQLDPNFLKKCDYTRSVWENAVPRGPGRIAPASGIPFSMPVEEATDISTIQWYLYKFLQAQTELYKFIKFWDGPRQIFQFDRILAEALSNTDVQDVPWSEIRLPYDEFYIHFGPVVDYLIQFNNRVYRADGAYVRKQGTASELFPIGSLHITFSMRLIEPSYKEVIGAALPGFIIADPLYEMTLSGEPTQTVRDALAQGEKLNLKAFQNFDTILQRESVAYAEENGLVLPPGENMRLSELQYERGKEMMRENLSLLVNCLFYLTNIADTSEPSYPIDAPQHLVKKLERCPFPGRQKVLQRQIEQNGFTKVRFIRDDSFTDRVVGVPTGKDVRTHWRRGHWRRQPSGAGLTQIKLIWIKPVLVNSDKGEPTSGRVYQVMDSPDKSPPP